MNFLKKYRESVEPIIEDLDFNICKHNFQLKHFTLGNVNAIGGGDVWQIYCISCCFIKEDYSVGYYENVDWNKIDRMKKHLKELKKNKELNVKLFK